jgi:transcriptional regulator with XRE-family HTH domain
MTQQSLGAACGLTFQQIQKYESARCRVSATVLWRLSQALDVEMNYFFEGLDDESAPSRQTPRTTERPYLRLAV